MTKAYREELRDIERNLHTLARGSETQAEYVKAGGQAHKHWLDRAQACRDAAAAVHRLIEGK